MSWGKFYAIGVGPGDPELLTIKAQRILKEVDHLFIPVSKREKRSLALSIIKDMVIKDWQCHELLLPMTREVNVLEQHWELAGRQVLDLLKAGKDAAFITLGDPGMYSSFTYLFRILKRDAPQLEVEIIPGVSSINAISAFIQEPLAEGDESLFILPAGLQNETISGLIEIGDNILLLKAGNEIEKIKRILKKNPGSKKTYLVSRCGFPDTDFTDDLNGIEDNKLDYLTSILIKKNHREELS